MDSRVSISKLKSYEEYNESLQADGFLIMGRADNMADYRGLTEYHGRILHPEKRGQEWSLERNMAFFAGGIASSKLFKIISPMSSIYKRAQNGLQFSRYGLGGTVKELLWLEDNGYTFIPDKKDKQITWAVPPKDRVLAEPMIIKYKDDTFANDAHIQVSRIGTIAQAIEKLQLKQGSAHSDDSKPEKSPPVFATKTNQAKNMKLFASSMCTLNPYASLSKSEETDSDDEINDQPLGIQRSRSITRS